MSTEVIKTEKKLPHFFDNFFKPWNEWLDSVNFFNGGSKLPAVNIADKKDRYEVRLAVPGMDKDDFKISVDGNMLTISNEKEESAEEKEEMFTRKEYSYSGFSRSFSLPAEIDKERIEAGYEKGVLKISLPKNGAAKTNSAKAIAVK